MATNEIFPYKIDHLQQNDGIEYVACKNAALVHISNLDTLLNKELKYPAKLNGYIAMVCTRGSLTLSVQMKDYTLTATSILIAPASVVIFRESHDCELFIMAFNGEFAADMNMDMSILMPIMTSLHSSCVVHKIEVPQCIEDMREAFENVRKEHIQLRRANPEGNVYLELAVRHMYTAFVYRLCDFVSKVNKLDVEPAPKDRSADYFKRLVSLLHEHYRTERSVEFYADQMNLTPKHLSRVVRKHSGKSVHQWIDEFVVLEIKNLIKYSDLSIQQISYELNFPNPSFMGQYFKRITGKTPGEYRREI